MATNTSGPAPDLHLTHFKALVFDVYGTLVDWESGILAGLRPLATARGWSNTDTLAAFSAVEADLQAARPELLYSALLAEVHRALARGDRTDEDEDAHVRFGQSIKDWRPFPDTVRVLQTLAAHYKLVVLSNVDRASFAATEVALTPPGAQSPFAHVTTAQDTGAYKPSPVMLQRTLSDIESKWGWGKDEVLVVAASLRHDHVPANEMGVASVWIERPRQVIGQQVQGARWVRKFGTLGEMAEAVEKELQQGEDRDAEIIPFLVGVDMM